MTFVYWTIAACICLIMGTVTSLAVTFVLGLTLTASLLPENKRLWDLFISAVIFVTYLVVTATTGAEVLPGRALQSWTEVWTSLEALLHAEVVWLFRIAGFWAAIVFLVHLVPYRRM